MLFQTWSTPKTWINIDKDLWMMNEHFDFQIEAL